MISKDLQDQLLSLQAIERIHVVELLIESLDKPDIKIQNKWIKESEKRYDAFKTKKIKAVSYDDILNRIRK